MRRFARVLAALALVGFVGCGSSAPQGFGAKDKPPPQVLTVEEFFADTNKEERDLRLVGQLKSWKGNPGKAFGSTDIQATIASEKGKTCSAFVPSGTKPGPDETPPIGKWIIIDVRGSNKPVSRTNGEFTKGTLLPGAYVTQDEALKAAGR